PAAALDGATPGCPAQRRGGATRRYGEVGFPPRGNATPRYGGWWFFATGGATRRENAGAVARGCSPGARRGNAPVVAATPAATPFEANPESPAHRRGGATPRYGDVGFPPRGNATPRYGGWWF